MRSHSSLTSWMQFNGVKVNAVHVGPLPGFEARGATLIAEDDAPSVVVPHELILSRECVNDLSKADRALRLVLDVAGPFAKVRFSAVVQNTSNYGNFGSDVFHASRKAFFKISHRSR